MKQTVVDVLMYLFESIVADDALIDPERDLVIDRLEEMGFPHHEILKAFDWLEDLADMELDSNQVSPISSSIRIYSELEKILLDNECIGFLTYLEQNAILNPASRELILDRVIALDVELDLEQLKWIVMIVLYSYPGEAHAFAWMESMVFDQITADYMH